MDLFAVTAPGLSAITAAELTALGVTPLAVTRDGVSFRGDIPIVARANLELRTASRIVVRMGSFRARTFAELERHAGKLNWQEFVADGAASFRVSASKCRLYHTAGIAQRLAAAAGVRRAGPADVAAQLFIVRGLRDQWLVSADSSGEHLHRRGYRLATAKAPLRETLAAAALLASGWDRRSPLIDPFCGAGTICIEAALLAHGIPVGRRREFAFTRWPAFAAQGSVDAERPAATHAPPSEPGIFGYDRDAGAIQSAAGNSARASVQDLVTFQRQAISELQPTAERGWLVTNPPYGVRVGERRSVRALYSTFGDILRERFSGWRVAFFSADVALERATGLSLETLLSSENGGLPVRLVTTEI